MVNMGSRGTTANKVMARRDIFIPIEDDTVRAQKTHYKARVVATLTPLPRQTET